MTKGICGGCRVVEPLGRFDFVNEWFQLFKCIIDNPGVHELMLDAPLELAYNSYLVYHGEFS